MVSSLKRVSNDQVSKVRGQVLNQKNATEACKYARTMDHLHSTTYQQHSLGFTKEGPRENIKVFDGETLSSFASGLYVNSNMSIGISGANVDLDSAYKTAAAQFQESGSAPSIKTPQFYGSSVTDRTDSEDDNCLVTFAFDGLPKGSRDLYKLLVVRELVGDFSKYSGAGDAHSGNLAEHLATEHLCDSFHTFNQSYSNCGFFGITLASQGRKLDDLCVLAISEFVRFAHNARPNEVQRAAARLKNVLLAQDDGAAFMSKRVASNLINDISNPTLKEQIAAISSINENSIRSICRTHFMDVEPVIVGVGNTRCVPDYNQVRGYTHWWRI